LDAVASPDRGGWSLFVTDRAENPRRYTDWQKQRASAWAALRRGAFADVADRTLTPPADGPTPWPALDAARLRATAMLAAGRPAEAAAVFTQAAQRAASWDRRVAAWANLFATLSHQLAANPGAASQTRADALSMIELSAIHDPMILRLLLETQASAGPSIDASSPRQIQARLGRVELQRGSPQAALLAWRAAETEPGAEPTLNRLRLSQAEALIALGQDEPAIAMLIGLARTDVRPQALAMLGLVQMRRGQVDIALAVFREAVDATTAQAHPDVYADAGLALLSTGDRQTGLDLLDQARDAYQSRGNAEALRQLLTNQLHYAQAVNNPALATQARQMLHKVKP
jgi:tetratricopeptide (TPR) repeat protein